MRLYLLSVLLLIVGADQFVVEDLPSPTDGFIADPEHFLSPAVLERLNSEIRTLDGYEFGVALVGSVKPLEIERYSVRLFNRWGIGDAKRNNGVLMVLAISDRTMRIQTARQSRVTLTDRRAHAVIEAMKPFLREDQFDHAVSLGVSLVMQHLVTPVGWWEWFKGISLPMDLSIVLLMIFGFFAWLWRDQRRHNRFVKKLQKLKKIPPAQARNICVICLDPNFVEDTQQKPPPVVELTCGHQFHEACVKEWLLTNPVCPLCRVSQKEDSEAKPPKTLPPRPFTRSSSYTQTMDRVSNHQFLDALITMDPMSRHYQFEHTSDSFTYVIRSTGSSTSESSSSSWGGGSCSGGGGSSGSW